jgi:hypothetical protein
LEHSAFKYSLCGKTRRTEIGVASKRDLSEICVATDLCPGKTYALMERGCLEVRDASNADGVEIGDAFKYRGLEIRFLLVGAEKGISVDGR